LNSRRTKLTSFALAAAGSATAAFGSSVSPFAFAMASETAPARREGRSDGATAQVAAGAGGGGVSRGASDLGWQACWLCALLPSPQGTVWSGRVCLPFDRVFCAARYRCPGWHAPGPYGSIRLDGSSEEMAKDRTGAQLGRRHHARTWGHHTNSAPRHHHIHTHTGHSNLFQP